MCPQESDEVMTTHRNTRLCGRYSRMLWILAILLAVAAVYLLPGHLAVWAAPGQSPLNQTVPPRPPPPPPPPPPPGPPPPGGSGGGSGGAGGGSAITNAGGYVTEIFASGTVTATAPLTPTGCLNDLTYLADVTIPDYTRLQPGEAVTKTWRVRNTGTCTWAEDYRLLHVQREQLGGPAETVISDTVPAGGTTEIAIPLVAPDTPGTHTGVWRMADGEAVPFGEILTAVIVIDIE